jgi:hypothetical protein
LLSYSCLWCLTGSVPDRVGSPFGFPVSGSFVFFNTIRLALSSPNFSTTKLPTPSRYLIGLEENFVLVMCCTVLNKIVLNSCSKMSRIWSRMQILIREVKIQTKRSGSVYKLADPKHCFLHWVYVACSLPNPTCSGVLSKF